MRRRIRLLGALLLAGATGGVIGVPFGGAATAAPDSGWWSRTNVGLPTDPGAPPDVGATDLYVAGGGGSGTSVSQAVAAVRTPLPAGAGVRSLRLAIKGTAPSSVTVKACATTSNWKPVQGGRFADAPASDCAKSAAGAVVGGDLVFDHIGDLVAPGASVISVVLLPGTADRIVLGKPTTAAFDIAPVISAPESAPVPADTNSAPVATGAPDSPPPAATESPSGPALAAPAPASAFPTPDLGSPVALPPSAASPGASAVTPAAPANGRLAVPARSTRPADDRVRSAAALVVILLLAGYTAIDHSRPTRGPRPLGPFARGAVTATLADTGLSTERGIGRFRQTRRGKPARL